MALDPNTPIIVGVGQVSRRVDDPAQGVEPVDLMAEAARAAGQDSAARGDLVRGADSIRVVAVLSWRYTDPGALLATRLGATPHETVVTTTGRHSGQLLVDQPALAIQPGEV